MLAGGSPLEKNGHYIDPGATDMVVTMPESSQHHENPCGAAWREHLTRRRVYIETYGCRFNFGDTAKLIEVLRASGSTIVESPDDADAVIINTCTVVGPTERRMLRRLSLFRDRDLYVTGCMPAIQRDAIFSICTPTIIPPEEIREAYLGISTVSCGSSGIVQIAKGCAGRCTYCITRVARGSLKSFGAEEILGQVRAFAHSRTPEIQLTAQDVSSWGRDTGKSFPDLLRLIGGNAGDSMVRVGMMNPATILEILDDLSDSFESNAIFKFAHIPVQSGSNEILDRMKRGYRVADFKKIVGAFRTRYLDFTLATDVIVGFPGETDEDFARSCELIERIRPNKVNVTRYSKRPFTDVFSDHDFPDSIKKDRSRKLNAIAEKTYRAINKPLIGTSQPFIVTEKIREGSVMARSPGYVGIVLNEDLPLGYRGDAVLKKDRKYFFIGELA